MLATCCQVKYVVPILVGMTAMVAFYVLDLLHDFEPILSDVLPTNNNATELYAIIVPAGLSHDYEAQRAPLDLVLDQLEHNEALSEAALQAGELFVSNSTSTTTTITTNNKRKKATTHFISVAWPIECSFQLYKVDVAPEPDDMWTARGILVQTNTFAETKQLVADLQQLPSLRHVPLQAIRFGPGPFVHGNHPVTTTAADSWIFGFLMTYWVESLISMHWETFDYQDKFVVMRLEVMALNVKEQTVFREYIIMKPDSLDVYELIYPNNKNS